jgi:hypothetical protein
LKDLVAAGIPLGSVDQARQVAYYEFVKLVFPAPTGTLRLTNYPASIAAGQIVNADIDGSAQDWDASHPMFVEGVTYGRDTPLNATAIQVANGDNFMDDLEVLHGLMGIPCTIWRAHFGFVDVAAGIVLGAMQGKIRCFDGKLDRASLPDTAVLTLLPHRSLWTTKFPGQTFNTRDFPFMKTGVVKIEWGPLSTVLPPTPRYGEYWPDPPGGTKGFTTPTVVGSSSTTRVVTR